MPKGLRRLLSGIVLILLSGGLFGYIMYDFAMQFKGSDNLQRFIVPGEFTTTLSTPGRYVLWNNHQTNFQGKAYYQNL